MPMTPEEIESVTFSPLQRREHGYAADEVDEFLARAARMYRDGTLTPQDVEGARFSGARRGLFSRASKRGYDCEEVDAFLDRLAEEARRLRSHAFF